MTWKILTLTLVLLVKVCLSSTAPFIDLNQIHQARSEFQINLILNENRNYPIILVTISNDEAEKAAQDILSQALRNQPDASFAILVDCKQFSWDLNHTLRLCENYNKDEPVQEGSDPSFMCQFLYPDPVTIKQKGHSITKSHGMIFLEDSKNFNADYLTDMLKDHISDFVQYIEDEYDLEDFLQIKSDFKVSKLPKLLYFDDNLLAPLFLRKMAAFLDGKIFVGVTDDTIISKKYNAEFDSIILLEFDYETEKYVQTSLPFNSENPIPSFKQNEKISQYLQVKKSRDIALDFEHKFTTLYNFSSLYEVSNLISHGRIIILQVSDYENTFDCPSYSKISQSYDTFFNYICFNRKEKKVLEDIVASSLENSLLLIIDSISKSKVFSKQTDNFYPYIPQTISRQRVSSQSEADLCIRAAMASERDPVFYYFNEKSHKNQSQVMNYLNSLSEVTSLLYFCQIYLPDTGLTKKFGLKQNTIFTLFDVDGSGNMQKFEHTKIQKFIQIKMFLREISIKKMTKIYDDRILRNSVEEITSAEDLTKNCFNSKCIIALIATGRYREDMQIKMLKEMKLMFVGEGYKFYWINGICHWDVPKQLKFLKKKERVIQRSYAFFYREKDSAYSLWKNGKFWDKKEFIHWIKSLRNSKSIKSLKFGIDIEDRTCQKIKPSSEQL